MLLSLQLQQLVCRKEGKKEIFAKVRPRIKNLKTLHKNQILHTYDVLRLLLVQLQILMWNDIYS